MKLPTPFGDILPVVLIPATGIDGIRALEADREDVPPPNKELPRTNEPLLDILLGALGENI